MCGQLLLLHHVAAEAGATADGMPHTLRNRRLLREAATGASSDGDECDVQLPCPAPIVGPQFDALLDRSCVDEGVLADLGALLGRLSTISYSRNLS